MNSLSHNLIKKAKNKTEQGKQILIFQKIESASVSVSKLAIFKYNCRHCAAQALVKVHHDSKVELKNHRKNNKK